MTYYNNFLFYIQVTCPFNTSYNLSNHNQPVSIAYTINHLQLQGSQVQLAPHLQPPEVQHPLSPAIVAEPPNFLPIQQIFRSENFPFASALITVKFQHNLYGSRQGVHLNLARKRLFMAISEKITTYDQYPKYDTYQ